MSLVDIRAMIVELNSKVKNYRLANFYDLVQTKGFLLKFSKTEAEKIYVVVESGMRLHTTKFERDKNQLPSSFTAKIRKYIRTRKLENVQQLGIDRIVEFTFGKEENAYRLICEFYAKGNITLTDSNYKILAILRAHNLEENVKYAVGEQYPIDTRRQIDRLTDERLEGILKTAEDPKAQLKNFLNIQLYHGPNFAQHCVISSGLKPNIKVSEVKKGKKSLNSFF
jgi:predicted ribosome quality control (RQC) complex YloA/Tae2 family protein